jgi:hypothetical protein
VTTGTAGQYLTGIKVATTDRVVTISTPVLIGLIRFNLRIAKLHLTVTIDLSHFNRHDRFNQNFLDSVTTTIGTVVNLGNTDHIGSTLLIRGIVQLDKSEKFVATDRFAAFGTTVVVDMTANRHLCAIIGPTDTIDRNHFSHYNRPNPYLLDASRITSTIENIGNDRLFGHIVSTLQKYGTGIIRRIGTTGTFEQIVTIDFVATFHTLEPFDITGLNVRLAIVQTTELIDRDHLSCYNRFNQNLDDSRPVTIGTTPNILNSVHDRHNQNLQSVTSGESLQAGNRYKRGIISSVQRQNRNDR